MTCEYCNSPCDEATTSKEKLDRCFDSKFFDSKTPKLNLHERKLRNKSSWRVRDKMQMIKYNISFFLEDVDPDRSFFKAYYVKIRVTDPNNGITREGYILESDGDRTYRIGKRYNKTVKLMSKYANFLSLIKIEGITFFKEEEAHLKFQKNLKAIEKAAREAKEQGLHLDPTKYTDIQDYLRDLEELKKKNQETIETLKVTEEEHAAAIARLQQIQAELEKRKKIAQELEKSQIFEKITKQKHDLELTNKVIDDKAKEVKRAQEAGETAKAKKLNEEYLELKRKQGAILAFIVNLEQNAQYNTFIKFDSLEQLYSPNYQWPTNDKVLIEEYQFTTWDKVQPYVWGGLGIGAVILVIWLSWKYLIKSFRP